MVNIESKMVDLEAKILEQGELDRKTSKRIDRLAESVSKSRENLHSEINEMKQKLREQHAEIQMLKNSQKVATAPNAEIRNEPLRENEYTQYQNNPRMNIIIEGLKETEGENLLNEITQLCDKMDVEINTDEIAQAWRLKRKFPIPNKPNPVKICFKTHSAKEQVMRSKYKLKHKDGTEHVWINHDEPTEIRRAKGKARHIASYSRRKGSQAQITPNGIVLDNVFYTYENLDRVPSIYIPPNGIQYPILPRTHGGLPNRSAVKDGIPVPMTRDDSIERRHPQPASIESMQRTPPPAKSIEITTHSPKTPRTKKTQKMRLTRSGLVYSGPTAIFSHLYKATFTNDDTPYNSVEQKLQYEKAMMAKDLQAAETIMATDDTWIIKQTGDKVKVTQEYIDNRLHIATIGNEAKYRDNPDLMEVLLDTGDLKLVEGATSSFWAGGEPYNSVAYDNEDAHGKNHQGEMLMNLRTNERARRAALAQP